MFVCLLHLQVKTVGGIEMKFGTGVGLRITYKCRLKAFYLTRMRSKSLAEAGVIIENRILLLF